jgi:hypothetical protein
VEGRNRKEATNLTNVGQSEPPGGFVCSFIRALLHVLDLRDPILAAMHRLADLEAFELRMVEVERLVLAGVPMGETECFRLGPGFERRLALPYCM